MAHPQQQQQQQQSMSHGLSPHSSAASPLPHPGSLTVNVGAGMGGGGPGPSAGYNPALSLSPYHPWYSGPRPQPPSPHNSTDTGPWRFVQSFGQETFYEAGEDLITCVVFDHTGDFMAVGDKAGRISLFETTDNRHRRQRAILHPRQRHALQAAGLWHNRPSAMQYRFYTEFQSHDAEFDCLKSLEIEEKINQIRWLPHKHGPLAMLSTNDRTIKLWTVTDRRMRRPASGGFVGRSGGSGADHPLGDDREPSAGTRGVPVLDAGSYAGDPSNARDLDNGFVLLEDRLTDSEMQELIEAANALSGLPSTGGSGRRRSPQAGSSRLHQRDADEAGDRDLDLVDPGDHDDSELGGSVDKEAASLARQLQQAGYREDEDAEDDPGPPPEQLIIPRLSPMGTMTRTKARRIYSSAHTFHIHSLSTNSDGETFLSADDLRINLWNLEVANESFTIVDTKPTNFEDLSEVITTASFHPRHCNIMIYGTSRGAVRLADLRDSALCDTHVKSMEVDEDPATKNFFSEIITPISDCRFTPDGRYILTRDYLTMKIWDVNMENRPVAVVPVHDYLLPHLVDVYENDAMFDRFECVCSPDGTKFASGSYGNRFTVHDLETRRTRTLHTKRGAPPLQPGEVRRGRPPTHTLVRVTKPPSFREIDFNRKYQHMTWHPSQNLIAVAGLNKLFLYHHI